jgi:hypothetical protein
MGLNPISHYNPIIAPLIKILDPSLNVRYHFIRGVLEYRHLIVKKIHTKENVVDMFTNAVPLDKIIFCRRQFGLVK